MTIDKHRKRAARLLAAERGISYTAAVRALQTQPANSTSESEREVLGPALLLLDDRTGCWRSWTGPVAADPPTGMVENGNRLRGDIRIAGEVFLDDGALQVVQGDTVRDRLQALGAPIGSKCRPGLPCAVCHAQHQYDTPTTVEELTHRCHQIRAAFEQLALVEPGQGAIVNCSTRWVDGDVRLEATVELTDAVRAPAWLSDGSLLRGRSRLIGFEWSSDNGWTAVLDAPGATEPRERLRMFDTLLNWDVWLPYRIAAVIDQTRRRYCYDSTTDTPSASWVTIATR